MIVPVYNAEKYLDECIESILNQSFSAFELILLPGSSTDNSSQICENWKKKDNRIRIVIQDINSSGYARNKGIREAAGEYICFCDADDKYCDDYLKKMYESITSNNADVAECMFYIASEDLRSQRLYPFLEDIRYLEHSIMERQGSPAVWKYISKKTLWIDNDIVFPEIRIAEDLAVYTMIWAYCLKINYVYEPLYIYRIVDTSLSRTKVKLEDRIANLRGFCEYTSSEFKKRGLYEQCRSTLISQAEYHLSGVFQFIEDAEDNKDISAQMSDIIKDSFGVSDTVYDHSVLGWGGKEMHPLCARLRKNPSKDLFSIKDMSMSVLCDQDLQKQFRDYCDQNEHDIVIVDLISEAPAILEELADISSFIQKWALGAGIFLSCINKVHPKVYLLEKYVADNYYSMENTGLVNKILKMLHESFIGLCPGCKYIPSIPAELYKNNEENDYNISKYDCTYYYEKIVDDIHTL
ncbi:glycosyltransferase [Butyrivibrio sp. DSM 10294]|uniref:glycosyltransferase family 2 protein n=1 Tax=Butyrivibrio sp. DSM 10294 TaxID=2972457 RepID=UPI00234F55FA|nr:glycosyltransferase family 2 protein [Butyrivibrio sp. DSM 10294]MDC7293590.1 glycosyltransferase [Butyrivibrio sp. DSM 10294]